MFMTTADLLLHPVRLRIVQAFLGDRPLTTSQLAAELDDVPPASLYRHVAKLVQAGVLIVVAERRVRGANERTYMLRARAARVSQEDLAAMTAEEHQQAFMAFVAGMVSDFDRYLARGDIDLARDRVGYRMAALWLTDEEFRELVREIGSAVGRKLPNGPADGRTRRLMRTILLPGEP
jgi:DNA-binding transcriptional ArsR family regulator